VPLHYADTSALVKLVVAEAETASLVAWLRSDDRTVITADLTRTELMRAVLRSAPRRATRVRDVLDGVSVVSLTPAVLEAAGRLTPPTLRSLDAIHLSAALVHADELASVLTYDERMSAGAAQHGLRVETPGR
jgi:uncharacterized protein